MAQGATQNVPRGARLNRCTHEHIRTPRKVLYMNTGCLPGLWVFQGTGIRRGIYGCHRSQIDDRIGVRQCHGAGSGIKCVTVEFDDLVRR